MSRFVTIESSMKSTIFSNVDLLAFKYPRECTRFGKLEFNFLLTLWASLNKKNKISLQKNDLKSHLLRTWNLQLTYR